MRFSFIFLFMLAATFPVPANFPALVTAKSGLVMRNAPRTSGRVLATLTWRGECTVLDPGGREEIIGGRRSRWWRVSAGGKTGWAFGAFLVPAPLTEARLVRAGWFTEAGNGIQLNFHTGGKLTVNEAWDGGERLTGKWRLVNGTVVLTITTGNWSDMRDGFKGFRSLSGALVALTDSVYGILALSLRDPSNGKEYRFRDVSLPVPADAIRMHKGRRVVILGSKTYITTDNAMFRKGPAVTTAAIRTRLRSGEPERPYLPRGTVVYALWRTKRRYLIGRRAGHWYRVTVTVDREIVPSETGWVFGAFLKEHVQ